MSTSNGTFEPTGFFALRTPLLPCDVLTNWARDLEWVASGASSDSLGRDRETLAGRLREIVARPDVREAIYLASPSTDQALEEWLAAPDARDSRLEQTLAKYVQRMAGRATPFGLFAGCSVGVVGDETSLHLPGMGTHRRHARLDNDYLYAIGHHLQSGARIADTLHLRANSSLNRVGDRWHYVEIVLAGMRRRESLVALEATEFLDATIERARAGATIAELATMLVNLDADGEITQDDAREYLRDLLRQQVLTSELAPLVTGLDALADLRVQVQRAGLAGAISVALEDAERRLDSLNQMPLGATRTDYAAIQEAIEMVGIKADPTRLFQVDLYKPAHDLRCGRDLVEKIGKAVGVLHRMTSSQWSESFRRFKDQFLARYERREMPLLEVLDEELGIGFDSNVRGSENAPLIDGLPFTVQETGLGSWTPRDAFLLAKLVEVTRRGRFELSLTEDDLRELSTEGAPLPDGFSVIATCGEGENRELEILIRMASGPSGANLLGRFCHGDVVLADWVRRHLQKEEEHRPDAIFAEIVHLPEGRMGNILGRPVLRAYEIAYLGRSGADEDRQLAVSDLFVSVVDDRVVLRSKRLNAEILPRMTNAHAYHRAQPVYRFLCSLQFQGIAPMIAWSWGTLETAPHLPRVRYGNIILARAKWNWRREFVQAFSKAKREQQFAMIQTYRGEFGMPRFVVLAEGDNELPVDLDNPLSIEAAAQVLKKRDAAASFVELYPTPANLVVSGDGGRYVSELVVPFTKVLNGKAGAAARPSNHVPVGRAASVTRHLTPGSECLYLKFYAGVSGIDVLIRDVITDVVGAANVPSLHKWFFVRYGDPDWHVRFRVWGDPSWLHDLTRQRLPQLLAGRATWKITIDTYEREIERYGGDEAMVVSEDLFHRDSDAALRLMPHLMGDANVTLRWQACLKSWDLLLNDFGMDTAERLSLVRSARASYARQLRSNKSVDRVLGDRFRYFRKRLEILIRENDPSFASIDEVLRDRSSASAQAHQQLRDLIAAGAVSTTKAELAMSHLHMNANRLLRSAHRQQEFTLYDFLGRIYESDLARQRGRGRRAPAADTEVPSAIEQPS